MNSFLILLSLLLGAAQPVAAPAEREGYFPAADGTRLFYRIEGSGPQTLVVVHGGPGNSMESVRPDFGPLARGRRVIYYDQRGNGRSELVGADRLGLDRHINDLEDLRRHFGLERLTLLGNSWGGLLVSSYAAAHPDRVERLVLDAPAPPTHYQLDALGDEFARRARVRFSADEVERLEIVFDVDNWTSAQDPLAVCRDFAATVLRLYQFDPQAELRARGDLCAGPTEAVRRQQAVNRAIWQSMGDFDLRPRVRRVSAPVLVMYGEADAIPLEGAQDWARNYPNARLLLVRQTGHLIHIEQPDAFFSAVDRFLDGAWPAGAERVARSPGAEGGSVSRSD